MTRWSDKAAKLLAQLPFTVDSVLVAVALDDNRRTVLNPSLVRLKLEAEQLLDEHRKNLKKRGK